MAKITKRTVDALKLRAKPFIAFDDDVKGFGLRVMPSGQGAVPSKGQPLLGCAAPAGARSVFKNVGADTVAGSRFRARTGAAAR